jgi:hypothetical protein
MHEPNLDYAAIRRRIAGRLRRHLLFWGHLLVYIVGICANTNNMYYTGAILVWGIVVLLHFALAYGVDIWRMRVENATRDEIERLRKLGFGLAETGEKPKRDEAAPHKIKNDRHAVRLTDDGELQTDDEPYENSSQQNQNKNSIL